jgi:hypothetical protein
LTGPPSSDLNVTATRASGDSDVTVTAGSSLTFTSANFATPQTVTLSAAEDADSVDDIAVIAIQALGLTAQTVNVTVTDNETIAPAFTSTPDTSTVVNAPYSYQATASGQPAPTFSLVAPPDGMTIHPTTGVITWTPAAIGSFAVTIAAGNGTAPDASQSFDLQVVTDQPPVASMTQPYPGEIVSGAGAEWFGDGADDVGCTQAEFFIDGVLVDTDVNNGGHYHIGGTHLLWNTTLLSNGAHTLRMTVTDTAGQTGSIEIEVIVANGIAPLDGWKLAKFSEAERLNEAISGNEADPENDGFTNLMEYALGLEPKLHADPVRLPGVIMESDYLALKYRRPVNGRPGLSYTVQVGGNLSTWASGPTATTPVGITPNGDGTETVIVRDNVPVSGEGQRFIRLQVPSP